MAREELRISKHYSISAVAAGTETAMNIGKHSGEVEQVVVRASAGGGATVDIEVRLISGNSDLENLVYQNAAAAYTVVDSAIDAPFDTMEAVSDDDLYLYLAPAVDGTLEVRVDFKIFN